MTRLFTATLLILTLALPFSATAETAIEKAPEGAVARASIDALPLPIAAPTKAEDRTGERTTPRGSSQSAAGYRFTSPYAFPLQTLPIYFPTLTPINF